MRKKAVLRLGAAGALGLLMAIPLFAGEGDVTLGGEVLLRIRYPRGGLTVQQQADKVTERLVNIIGDPTIKAEDIYMKKMGKEYSIFIRKQIIITTDERTAKANGMTSEKLAQRWLKIFKRVVPECVPRIFPVTAKPKTPATPTSQAIDNVKSQTPNTGKPQTPDTPKQEESK